MIDHRRPHTPTPHHGPAPDALRPHRRGTLLAAFAVVAVASLAATTTTACSQDDDASRADSVGQEAGHDPSSVPAAADDDATAEGEGSAAGTEMAAPAVELEGGDAAAGRQVILDGTVVVEVQDLDRAMARAEAAVLDVGGFLASEQLDNSSGASPSASAAYRVPPAAFHDVLDLLDELGEVQSQQLGARDVADEVADLDSRLATLQTSIERLRGFLGTAGDATQIGILEGELTRRESEAASIVAQRRALGDQVDFASISVEFLAPGATPPVEPSPSGFSGGWQAGIGAAAALGRGALAGVGFLIPFLPLVLVGAVALVWLRRRGRSGIAPGPSAVS